MPRIRQKKERKRNDQIQREIILERVQIYKHYKIFNRLIPTFKEILFSNMLKDHKRNLRISRDGGSLIKLPNFRIYTNQENHIISIIEIPLLSGFTMV
jgi:hypothetical protein